MTDMDDYSAHAGMVILSSAFTVTSSHKLISTISKDINEHDVVMPRGRPPDGCWG